MAANTNAQKRKAIVTTSTLGFPTYYLLKNRNQIYRSSSLLKEFHVKELVARSFFGLVTGFVVGVYFFGFSEKQEEHEDKHSLEYSSQRKKGFYRKTDFLPGKIRSD